MKSLLICTDFSASSVHAAKYACMLAKQYSFNYITLYYAYQSYIPTLTLPLTPHHIDEMAKASMKQLQDLQYELSTLAGPEITVNIRAEDISLGENINRICQRENCDMVIMGMKGKSNLEKVLTGSNTISVTENSYYPVILIPAEAVLQPIRRVLVACDLSKVRETIPVALLNEIIELFDAPLTVLNVDHKNKHFSPRTPDDLYRLHHLFDSYNPQYAFTDNKDVASGIVEYAEQNDISLIIAMPKNYNFLQNLFRQSTTEKLIYRSTIPLLTLHAP